MIPRIGLNLLWLRPGKVGGTESYATRLLAALVDTTDLDIVVFASAEVGNKYADLLSGFEVVSPPRQPASRFERVAIEMSWLRQQLKAVEIDLIHHLGGTVPVAGNHTVLTIHDTQPLDDPGNFGLRKSLWLKRAIPRSVARSDLIVTPSDWVGDALVERFGLDRQKVRTVPVWAPSVWKSAAAADIDLQAVRGLESLDGPFLLYPAMTMRHKNHLRLFRAFSVALARRPELHLVCVGSVGAHHQEIAQAARQTNDRIRLLGRVESQVLDGLYRACEAVVFPSLYEGFGLPVLEAQQYGKPVISSNATALPEVAGDDALLVDPYDVDAWADAMTDISLPEIRAASVASGTRNVNRYNAHRTFDAQVHAWKTLLHD